MTVSLRLSELEGLRSGGDGVRIYKKKSYVAHLTIWGNEWPKFRYPELIAHLIARRIIRGL